MIKKGYVPYVNYDGNKILSLVFEIGYIKYLIQNSIIEDDTHHHVDNDEYNKYVEADQQFYEWLINKNLLSRYSEQVGKINDAYLNAPMIGYFGKNKPDGYFMSVDRNKSYTSLLREIKYFPVFNVFENYKLYDNHEI